jgi:uncharacterized membrane protein YebE (DUF533 family)
MMMLMHIIQNFLVSTQMRNNSSGTTADGSSHSEAGGGAVEAQVQANKRGRKHS